MKFTYTPEGVDERSWVFEPNEFSSTDAELIEKRSGMKLHEWVDEVQGGSITAAHVLLFVLLRVDKPGLQYDQIVFKPREIGWTYTDAELVFYNAALTVKAARGELTAAENSILRSIQLDAERRGVELDPAKVEDELELEEPDDESDPTQPPSELKSVRAKPRKKAS